MLNPVKHTGKIPLGSSFYARERLQSSERWLSMRTISSPQYVDDQRPTNSTLDGCMVASSSETLPAP